MVGFLDTLNFRVKTGLCTHWRDFMHAFLFHFFAVAIELTMLVLPFLVLGGRLISSAIVGYLVHTSEDSEMVCLSVSQCEFMYNSKIVVSLLHFQYVDKLLNIQPKSLDFLLR